MLIFGDLRAHADSSAALIVSNNQGFAFDRKSYLTILIVADKIK